jgi:hypothetical protein
MSTGGQIDENIEEKYDVWRREGLDSNELYSVISSFQADGISIAKEFEDYKKGKSETGATIYTDLEGFIDLYDEEVWIKIEGENDDYDIAYWIDHGSKLTELNERIENVIERRRDEESGSDKKKTIEPVKFGKKADGKKIGPFDVLDVKNGWEDLGELSEEPLPRFGKLSYRQNIVHPYEFSRHESEADYMGSEIRFVEDGMYELVLEEPDDFHMPEIEGEIGRLEIKPVKSEDSSFKLHVNASNSIEAQKYLAEKTHLFLNGEIVVEEK